MSRTLNKYVCHGSEQLNYYASVLARRRKKCLLNPSWFRDKFKFELVVCLPEPKQLTSLQADSTKFQAPTEGTCITLSHCFAGNDVDVDIDELLTIPIRYKGSKSRWEPLLRCKIMIGSLERSRWIDINVKVGLLSMIRWHWRRECQCWSVSKTIMSPFTFFTSAYTIWYTETRGTI